MNRALHAVDGFDPQAMFTNHLPVECAPASASPLAFQKGPMWTTT
jgi:hypothetical protein